MQKQLVQRKIQQLVYLHGVYVKNLTGLEINQSAEYKLLWAEFQAGLISIEDIEADMKEYLDMRNERN